MANNATGNSTISADCILTKNNIRYYSTECSICMDKQQQVTIDNVLLGTSLGSVCCLSMVLLLYCRYRRLRSHLSRMVVYRVGCDFIMAALFTINLSEFSSTSCQSNLGWFLAFLIQTAFIAGECWFLCIAIDPVLSIARPFLSAKGKRRTYMVLVNTVACIFGILLLNRASTIGDHDGIGDSETFNRICWIANGKGIGMYKSDAEAT